MKDTSIMKDTSTYNEDSIDVLEGIQAIRKRPGMYILDVEDDGYHQLIKEILDNSVDEHLAGNCSEICVSIDTATRKVSISDNGRGIPTGIHAKTKISTLTTIFTVLHSGGKFARQAYAFSGGLHGVGATVVNALSEYFMVISHRNGKTATQEFACGVPTTEVIFAKDKTGATGTQIVFVPDREIFKGIVVDPKRVRDRLSEISYLCPGLTVKLSIDNESEVFKCADGIMGMINDYITENAIGRMSESFHIISDSIDITMAWTDADGEKWHSFVNVTPVPEGGTHIKGVRRAITKVLSDRSKEKLLGEDLREGLVFAIHVKVADPLFKGQTKSQLLNSEVEKAVYDLVLSNVSEIMDSKPELLDLLIKRAIKLKKARADFKKIKTSIKEVGVSRIRGILPGKLAEAPNCSPDEREIFIVEGNSAGGSAKQARDAYFQEVLPLRGKVQNTERATDARAISNKEFQSLIVSLGCGINHEASTGCQPENARVNKVLLLMDADPDGCHITTLLTTFFVNYMPQMIEAGKIYVVKSPLFIGYRNGSRAFGNSVAEIEKQIGAGARITRLKGHGEANPEEISDYAMNPDRRKLTRLKLVSKDRRTVKRIMGNDVAYRKELFGIATDSGIVAIEEEPVESIFVQAPSAVME